MNRRGFMVAAAGASLAGVPAAGTAARPAAIPSYVTSLREHAGGALPAPGAAVALVRAPERAFDPQSVAVAEGARRIGYLPAVHGRVLAPLIDAGFRFEARVAEVRGGRSPAVALEIRPA